MAHKLTNFGSKVHCDECFKRIEGDVWHVCNDKEMELLGLKVAKWLDLECLLLLQLRR